MVPVTDLKVKSVIAAPTSWAAPGNVRIHGAAWSNSSPVSKVDVSTDGGQTWKPAKLSGQQTQYGWRLWQSDWKASEGKYRLIARATNMDGKSQPLEEEWNPSGYLWNVAQPVEITVSRKPPVRAAEVPPTETAIPEGHRTACSDCHDEHMMVQQHLTREQWDREINKMTGWGAPVQPQDREAILDYLAKRFHL
jgi:hypothetical protein